MYGQLFPVKVKYPGRKGDLYLNKTVQYFFCNVTGNKDFELNKKPV